MHARSLLAACVTLIAVASCEMAASAPCAGFTDVDDTSGFCPNVEWLKNRSITLGCTSVTLYCPDDPVNRLQTAAFINRLGAALTPVELKATEAPAPRVLPDNPVICTTSDFVVTGFPRRAYVNAAARLSVPTNNVVVGAWAAFSTDAGANWSPVPASFQMATLYAGATPGNHATLAPFGYVDLNVGQSARFGVQLGPFGGPGNIVTTGCQNLVRIANRSASSSPLDPAAAPARRPGGS
jgi:hypothetical protein